MRTANNLNRNEKTYLDTWKNRQIVLDEIGMTYEEYLKSDHWIKFKEKVNRRKLHQECKICGSKRNLHLHHRHYRFLMHIHELNSIYRLCADCHQKVHDIAKRNNLSIRLATGYLRCKTIKYLK